MSPAATSFVASPFVPCAAGSGIEDVEATAVSEVPFPPFEAEAAASGAAAEVVVHPSLTVCCATEVGAAALPSLLLLSFKPNPPKREARSFVCVDDEPAFPPFEAAASFLVIQPVLVILLQMVGKKLRWYNYFRNCQQSTPWN
jgi:hypothetical protein